MATPKKGMTSKTVSKRYPANRPEGGLKAPATKPTPPKPPKPKSSATVKNRKAAGPNQRYAV